jgi:hypothetical protein
VDQFFYAKVAVSLSAIAFGIVCTVLIFSVLHYRDSFRKRLLFGLPLLALVASIGFVQMDMYRDLTGKRKPLEDDFFFAVLAAEFSLALAVMFARAIWLRRRGWWRR